MPDTVTLNGPVDLTRLAAPFPADAISSRVGATDGDKTKGLALAYIDARDVMNRLDEVCSPVGWQSEFIETPKGRVICRIGIRCFVGRVWQSFGAGARHVAAGKGAISDALKRAAVHWGVGRYLYSMPATWVAIEQRGKTSVIKDSEHDKLARVAAGGERHPSRDPQPRQQQATPQVRPQARKFVDKACADIEAAGGDVDAVWATFDEIKARPGWEQLSASEKQVVILAKGKALPNDAG